MSDHTLASLIPTGAAHVARCVCGEKFTQRFWEQAEESHTKHANEMARVAARRPTAAENRTAVEEMHEPLFGDQSAEEVQG